MPAITLPGSSVRRFDAPVTGATVAAAIGPGLTRAALAMPLDGKLVAPPRSSTTPRPASSPAALAPRWSASATTPPTSPRQSRGSTPAPAPGAK